MADEKALRDANTIATLIGVTAAGEIRNVRVDDNGYVYVNGVLVAGDIQIGAVELKNAVDDTRAKIGAGSGIAAGDNALATADANVKSDTAAIKTATEIMDDWDETDRAKVNLIAGQAGITAGAGVVATNTPRMTIANDDPAVVALQLIDNTIKVDDAAFTPATDSVNMVGAEFDDASPDSVNEGDAGALRMSTRRELYNQIRDAAGNERGVNVTASNELNVLDSNSGAIKTAIEKIDNSIGNVATIISVPVVSTTPAYTSGDNVGAKLTLTSAASASGGTGRIVSVTVMDKANQRAELDIVFFQADPTNSTITDNAAQTIHATDLLTICGTVTIADGHYISGATNCVGTRSDIYLPFTCSGSANLFALMITRSTPTYASTSDLKLQVGIIQD